MVLQRVDGNRLNRVNYRITFYMAAGRHSKILRPAIIADKTAPETSKNG